MIQQGQRFVLNGSSGVTNFVSKNEFYESMNNALDSFISQLADICGPFSRYSLLLRVDTQNNNSAIGSEYDNRAFIKDGKYLIQFSEYISPIENYIKSMILYIGSRIDDICHDGTTTSMLFACHMLKSLLSMNKHLELSGNKLLSRASTFKIEKAYKEAFDKIKKALEKEIITVDYLESIGYNRVEAAALLSYIQAQTSSGGDYEVAKELSKFFKYMPECSWNDAICNRIPAVENKSNRIEAVVNEYEVEVRAQCMSTYLHYNYDNENYYKNEDIDILIIPQPLPDTDFTTLSLYDWYDKRENGPLVILVPNLRMGNSVIPTLQEKAMAKKDELIVMSYYVPSSLKTPIYWDIDAIQAKANKPKFMVQEGIEIDNCVIHHADILVSPSWIRINNLTPKEEREYPENTHPGLTYSDDYIHFTRFKNKLDKEISLVESFHRKDPTLINLLKQANTRIHVTYPLIMKLGGMSHEMQAMIPVLEDCSGASMAAIEYGILLNGIFRLAKVCKELLDNVTPNTLEEVIYTVAYNAALSTTKNIFGPNNDEDFITIENNLVNFDTPTKYLDITDSDMDNVVDTYPMKELNDYFDHLVKTNYDGEGYNLTPPIQPANFMEELLDRCREILVRISMSNSLVVPGSAWIEKDKTNGNS